MSTNLDEAREAVRKGFGTGEVERNLAHARSTIEGLERRIEEAVRLLTSVFAWTTAAREGIKTDRDPAFSLKNLERFEESTRQFLAARAVPAEVVLELSDTEREHILIEQAVGSAYNDSESEEILALLRDFNTVYAALAASEAKRKAAEAERDRAMQACEIIAGRRQCVDNLMSNQDIARAALDQPKTEDAV